MGHDRTPMEAVDVGLDPAELVYLDGHMALDVVLEVAHRAVRIGDGGEVAVAVVREVRRSAGGVDDLADMTFRVGEACDQPDRVGDADEISCAVVAVLRLVAVAIANGL